MSARKAPIREKNLRDIPFVIRRRLSTRVRANSDSWEIETRTGTKDRESVMRRGTDELPGGAGVDGLFLQEATA